MHWNPLPLTSVARHGWHPRGARGVLAWLPESLTCGPGGAGVLKPEKGTVRARGLEPTTRRCLLWSLTTGPGARFCLDPARRGFELDLNELNFLKKIQTSELTTTDGERRRCRAISRAGDEIARGRGPGGISAHRGRRGTQELARGRLDDDGRRRRRLGVQRLPATSLGCVRSVPMCSGLDSFSKDGDGSPVNLFP